VCTTPVDPNDLIAGTVVLRPADHGERESAFVSREVSAVDVDEIRARRHRPAR
jgi:hypothetical protein